jgi:hypothetical protein
MLIQLLFANKSSKLKLGETGGVNWNSMLFVSAEDGMYYGLATLYITRIYINIWKDTNNFQMFMDNWQDYFFFNFPDSEILIKEVCSKNGDGLLMSDQLRTS